MNKRNKILATLLVVSALLTISSKTTSAFSLDSLIDGVKDVFQGEDQTNNKEFGIDSKIELVSEGDLNKNGNIESGDTVRFSYTIANPTNNSYKSAVLKTNINAKQLNSITNVKGTVNLETTNTTIIIPHLTIQPNQVRMISFDARINFSKDTDQLVSTEPQIENETKSFSFKGKRQEVSAKKLDLERFNKFVHITK